MKQKAIQEQKKIISSLKGFASENAINEEIEKLNLLVDDFEKDNILINDDNIYLYIDYLKANLLAIFDYLNGLHLKIRFKYLIDNNIHSLELNFNKKLFNTIHKEIYKCISPKNSYIFTNNSFSIV